MLVLSLVSDALPVRMQASSSQALVLSHTHTFSHAILDLPEGHLVCVLSVFAGEAGWSLKSRQRGLLNVPWVSFCRGSALRGTREIAVGEVMGSYQVLRDTRSYIKQRWRMLSS